MLSLPHRVNTFQTSNKTCGITTPTGPRTASVEASNHHGGSSVLPPHPMQGRHYDHTTRIAGL
jgi:hypothetical protein